MGKTKKEMLEENIEDILNLKEQGLLLEDIAKIYDVSRQSIGRALKSVGKPARSVLTDEIKDSIIQEYINGDTILQISERYRFAEMTVSRILKENGIHVKTYSESSRKYTLNEEYFDVIDTPEKAYIIGLLMADGNVCGNKISISLLATDRHILDRINNLLGSNRSLYLRKYKDGVSKDQFSLVIVNKHMANRLKELGVIERKSLILKYPEWMPDDLFRHFVRGYIDGDGSIYSKRNAVGLLGTHNFCMSLKNKIANLLDINFGIKKDKRATNCYELYIKNYDGTKTFLDYIYKDATIYLNRKYETYINRYINNSHAA